MAAAAIWTGAIGADTFRVVDMGAGVSPRLIVEVRAQPDALGARGWQRYEPIPRDVFEAMLLAAGVVK